MSPSTFQRATKIVATIGTASGTPEVLRDLLVAGVNVFRLNFSHGTQDEQAERIRAIRALEDETGQPVCILADLQGPKHRVGKVEEGVVLAAGDEFVFDRSPDTESKFCSSEMPAAFVTDCGGGLEGEASTGPELPSSARAAISATSSPPPVPDAPSKGCEETSARGCTAVVPLP